MAGEVLKMRSGEQLSASVQRIKGKWASMGRELEKANQASVDFLNTRALRYLDESVREHGRPQRREGVLRNVFINDLASSKHRRGFRWGVSQKLNASGAGPYWRGVEQGTRIFVGRITRIVWIDGTGKVTAPNAGRYPSDARMPNDWNAALNGRGWISKIKRPIVGYEFMHRAAADFEAEGVYLRELAKADKAWASVLAESAASGIHPSQVSR